MERIPKYLMWTAVTMFLCLSSFGTITIAGDGPDEVLIDSLAQLYEPVYFDHAMHDEITDSNCSVCHHHTLGTEIDDENCMKCHEGSRGADEITCQGCHSDKRFEAEYLQKLSADNMLHHRDRLGLKAAYHMRCMKCHEEMGAANGCQDCHARTNAGDKFFHAGNYTPPKSNNPTGGH